MANEVSVSIPGVDFGAMARAAIAERLTAAMVGADDAIRAIVGAALVRKVNERGEEGRGYDEKMPYIEWLAADLIRKVTKEVLQAKAEALRPVIAAVIEAELKRNAKALARTLVNGWVESCNTGYRVSVAITPDEKP